MITKLTKSNCSVSKAKESGNLYITHPEFKVKLRFYAEESELKADSDWRLRVQLCEGEFGAYTRLAKSAMQDLDY